MTETETEAELRDQLLAAVEPAEYPVEGRSDVLEVLPDGMLTRFEAGEFSMTVTGIAARLYEYQDFPYETPEALVDDVIAGLNEEDLI